MIRVLIVEDEDSDTQRAGKIFQKLGLQIQSMVSVEAAERFLEGVAEGIYEPPHLIVLDLGFPDESGFALLRYWKSTPELSSIPIVVWTQMAKVDCDLAALFGVKNVIKKSQGPAALEAAVKQAVGI
ncbi:MAG TPA: response regulator [Terriglobales bacterium]|nr:response regulator [Terriglobales bacterium]